MSSHIAQQGQKNSTDITLVYKAITEINKTQELSLCAFYIFNAGAATGFVIVAGDDNVTPILAYSDDGAFDPDNIPPNAAQLLTGYQKEIRYVMEHNIRQSNEIKAEWEELNSDTPAKAARMANTSAVLPLIKTKWGQGSNYRPYNKFCPYDSIANKRTVTGCVATAMAQVMNFWHYPVKGTGNVSYTPHTHYEYGILSADFGNTTYQWDLMPHSLNIHSGQDSINAVATLMYHCGVSVDMNYGPDESGAWVIVADNPICAETALISYFNYSPGLHGVQSANYNPSDWTNMLMNEIDGGRPVLYTGFGSAGGHAFICDGYANFSGLKFDFNWGWDGSANGYFTIGMLNPAVGDSFNINNQAIIGLEPPPTAIKEEQSTQSQIEVFPNPLDGHFNIALNDLKTQSMEMNIVNLAGQTIMTERIDKGSKLDLSAQPKGLYILQLSNEHRHYTKKIIIQ